MDRKIGYASAYLIGGSVLMSAVAQLLFRFGMIHFDIDESWDIGNPWIAIESWATSISAWSIVLGGIAYTGSLICWLPALRRVSLSRAYPLLSLSYILVYLGAVYWPGLGESASALKVFGIATICVGVVLVNYQSGPSHTSVRKGGT